MQPQVQTEKCTCYHCGLPIVAGAEYSGELDGVRREFCCPACRAVAGTIHGSGLGNFYRYSEQTGRAVDETLVSETYTSFDDPVIRQRYVAVTAKNADRIASVSLLIGGMHCAACVWLLEKYLAAVPGVVAVNVSLAEQVAHIRWRDDTLKLSAIGRAIARLGYDPQLYTPDRLATLRQREHHQALCRLGVAGLAMMQVGMFAVALYAGALQGIAEVYRDYLRWISALVATPVVLYSARPFFAGAWRGLKTRSPGMDLPVAIAIGLAYLASLRATVFGIGEVYFDSVSMFTFLLLAGRYLEMRARHRRGQLSSDLNSLLPTLVTRVTQNGAGRQQQTVPLLQIAVGDRVLVKPGQVVPVDGVVVAGRGRVSQAHLTGEFMPLAKRAGDEVIAGSVNESGLLTVEACSIGADLKLQLLNTLLARARATKPPVARLADRLASRFVLGVLALAGATYIYWRFAAGAEGAAQAFWVMLSVLVVSCPCALSLATPAAITAAGNRLRQYGLLVTNPDVWEKTATITDVVCDKTGTLTRGELGVSTVLPLAGLDAVRCRQLATALERYSDHPIARAFCDSGSVGPMSLHAAPESVAFEEGRGLQATIDGRRFRIGAADYVAALSGVGVDQPSAGDQWVLLGSEDEPLCWFQLNDHLRDDADQCVSALKHLGLRLHLLSGDTSGSVAQIAQRLNFDAWKAGADPAQKLAYLDTLHGEGRTVLMLGDGLNDIPVLAGADISVAMSNASNLAKTQADAIALSGRLLSVVHLLDLAKRTRAVIRQNLGWALLYNALAIPLAAMALVPPYAAALGMSLSSLVVLSNALRLQRVAQVDLPESPPVPVGGAIG